MKLLMSVDGHGDALTSTIELCRGLDATDLEVVLAVFGRIAEPAQRRQLAALTHVELREYLVPLTSPALPDVDAATEWLHTLATQERPDVVHLGHPELALAADGAPLLITVHDCVLCRWEALRGAPPPRAWDRHRRTIHVGLRRARRVVAPTRTILTAVERCFGRVPHGCVIPYGRSPAFFHAARKELFVLAVGDGADEARNLEAVARAAPRLRVPVHFADATLAPAARAYWYGRAALFAQPSKYETFGLEIVEAALSRCALILGDVPGLRELWGSAALFVPSDDTDALCAAVHELASDPRPRHALARKAELRARALSPAHCAAAYIELYRSMLAEEGPRASLNRS